ncbi:tyrosine--tRNA ligase [Corynebacterium otitidis]|uniref:Tyrosine--tRNA ligase n=1 Tax=Corynebacterium otitidis ATCC 51513 TaxID=883169 RepID=I7L8Y8_9CORY|nr:tyrosine--tRNA ligase [Corynebacterium otitidis]EJZ82246.1 tyrosyl-tRNA synthetase [Corynebacterium otitidis ATCC 51513]CCI83472.1 tyrosyl-tRNA synthetase [Corynebacterium otitidis ATCC 51513]
MTETSTIIDELSWRGLINQSTDLDALKEAAAAGPITLYCGFDPTGPSLHAGHLVPLLMLARFQRAGHNPIVLAGGATGLIGDPREVGERQMNDADTVAGWAERISGQLRRFVDFEGEHAARLVNNQEWTEKLTAVEFLRDLGKHFSLNTMLSRETVRRRLENDGISYTEFSYMLLQANDFAELYRRYGCTLQVGGGDQWGNLVAGVDLNRRVNDAKVHTLTVPLVTDSEGKKFGKSTGGGSLWLDPEMTSPYAWYQYFFNTADADVVRYLRWFTFLGKEELDELAEQVENEPHRRAAQRRLAQEMTDLVHGEDARKQVELASQALFGRAELRELDEATLSAALRETDVAEVAPGEERDIVSLLVASGLAKSRGAARRSLKEGGIYVNNERVTDEAYEPASDDLLFGHWLVLRRGKKNFAGAHLA